jgi:hypothetical protein
LYYEEKIKARVNAAFAGLKLSAGDRLHQIRKITRDMYDAESNEVRAEVKAKTLSVNEELERSRAEALEGDESGERSPEMYLKYAHSLRLQKFYVLLNVILSQGYPRIPGCGD